MTSEPLVVDEDPHPDPKKSLKTVPVVLRIDVPPKGQSHGWGEMSWLRKRR